MAWPSDESQPLNRDTLIPLTLSVLWERLPMVLLGSGLFSLACAPAALLAYWGLAGPAIIVGALTVAPAWAALLALQANLLRGARTGAGAMLRAMPRYAARAAGLGLLCSLPLLAGSVTLPNLALPEVPLVVWGGLAADALGILIAGSLALYAFPLLVLHDMGAGTALRNAFLLAGRHVLNTVGLLSMAIVFAFAAATISSGLVLILPAFWGLFIVNNCRLVVQEELAAKA
jgi:hypothetical protein